MKNPPLFLAGEQVSAIHRRMLAEFGGRPGLRDRNLLESAVNMPLASFGGRYLHKGLPAMAAAYLFHLCKNPPLRGWQQTDRSGRRGSVPATK